ncbi:hypothetical protein [Polaromonas sp.]|uniref:hypothetical protein n=1 Tax=Polaromonas sp. TaxID=1869339 RepID=UPI00273117E9|nr:hypothetical protein [Polaromonas sp.]MDP1743150.1 hypothetical protein [Polaromonas sp.]
MTDLTPPQWQALLEAGVKEPQPLHLADLSVPFVYERTVGVLHCAAGKHRLAMSILLAFAHNCDSGIEVGERLGLDFPDETADRWLEITPGAAFMSSVGRKVQAGKRANLTLIEKRWLGDIQYLFDE